MPTVRFSTFPRTQPPQPFVAEIVRIFERHDEAIRTVALSKGLTSDQVPARLSEDLRALGFSIEVERTQANCVPVFFVRTVARAAIRDDDYHSAWRCGLEIEAGRA